MVTDVKITMETRAVAERLAEILNEGGRTIKEVSSQAGISDALLGAIINKKRNISPAVLVKLSLALGVPTDYLLGISAADDISSLERLKQARQQLEGEARALYAQMATMSSAERNMKMQEVNAVEEHIARLDTLIKRTSFGLLRIPELRGRGMIYLPADFVKADSCVVVRAPEQADHTLPANTVVFLTRSSDVSLGTDSAVYLVERAGRLSLTRAPSPDSEVIGGATYVLAPANAFIPAECAANGGRQPRGVLRRMFRPKYV